MTTHKMFLRDMKTTVQDMNRMTRRHIVAMALMLLLLVGGMESVVIS